MAQIDDSEILNRLVTDVKTAWNLATVDVDDPVPSESLSDYPRGFVVLNNVSPGRDSATAARDILIQLTYSIILQEPIPEESLTTIHALKVQRVNQLLSILTANFPRYGRWRYLLGAINFGSTWALQSGEAIFEIGIDFTVDLIIAA